MGITGGVASGKSTFSKLLVPLIGAKSFDADRCARELVENDPEVISRIVTDFGERVAGPDGQILRERLREFVFRDAALRRKLEELMHPLIRARWMGEAKEARKIKSWYLVDIPLLYETGVQSAFNEIVVVACSVKSQQERIVLKRGLTADMACQIIASQMGLSLKMARADHVVWSDCPLVQLEEQAQIFAQYLHQCYG